jgi:catechol 2,3-dioxygenase-like lactoylglutathione lyase family enzyme
MMTQGFEGMDKHTGGHAADHMATQQLLRAGALAAIVAGGLRILAAFIPYVPESPYLEALYAVIDLGFLFGLAAIYWPISHRLGRAGLMGYSIATAGVASIVGPDPEMFGLPFYMVGSAIFELGLLALAITLMHRNLFRATAFLWIGSLAAGLAAVATGGNAIAFVVAGCALGLGFIRAGYVTFKQARLAGPLDKPTMAFNQVTIGCSDLAESVVFYQKLGFRLIVDSAANGYARFEAPNDTTLSIHQGLPVPSGAVLYFEHAQLDSWVSRLVETGVVFDQLPADQSWGWREARLRDPAGNPLCLFWAGEHRRFPPWRLAE